MIVLEQDAVVQANPMVVAAAATNGVLFEQSPAWCCLARVEYLRGQAGDRFHIGARQRGDSAQPLHEVKGRPLTGQDTPHRAGHDRQPSSWLQNVTVARQHVELQPWINGTPKERGRW